MTFTENKRTTWKNDRSASDEQAALWLAKVIKSQIKSGGEGLIRVRLLSHFAANPNIPSISGIYIAVQGNGDPLYIGESVNLYERCRVSSHPGLKDAVERGADTLLISPVSESLIWGVEQRLLFLMSPPSNSSVVSQWWANIQGVSSARSPGESHRRRWSMAKSGDLDVYSVEEARLRVSAQLSRSVGRSTFYGWRKALEMSGAKLSPYLVELLEDFGRYVSYGSTLEDAVAKVKPKM